jgi:DNA helicase TIP49 (TBP-interacting protein)
MDTIRTVNKNELVAQGQKIYETLLQEKLEPEHKGEVVAIEVESGDYFLGESVVEVAKKARLKHPEKLFYFAKVGYRAMHIRR